MDITNSKTCENLQNSMVDEHHNLLHNNRENTTEEIDGAKYKEKITSSILSELDSLISKKVHEVVEDKLKDESARRDRQLKNLEQSLTNRIAHIET